MDIFLPQKDQLSANIQEKSALLLEKLRTLPVETLGLPYHCLEYFKSSHFRRLFFSIETSAHLLYRSITLVNKPVTDIVIMDYGAGVGTLYMLAKLIGCRTVIYNDHLEDWKTSALLIAEAIGIEIDEYIVGDIDVTLETLDQRRISCDIITSRNVIEHIYNLKDFYSIIARYQPNAVVYSSTTANYHNPAAHAKHILWHRKWEKIFLPQRMDLIRKQLPGLNEAEVTKLGKATRGLAQADFDAAISAYKNSKKLPDPSVHHTNTVETSSGVWFEHLLSFKEYRELIPSGAYELRFEPGFWDTHNTSGLKNLLGKTLNPFVKRPGSSSIRLAPFIYVIALPKKKERRNG